MDSIAASEAELHLNATCASSDVLIGLRWCRRICVYGHDPFSKEHPLRKKRARRLAAIAAVPVIGLAATACQGPNSPTDSYLKASASGVLLNSLLTVGDGGAADNGYTTVGVPDGLGAQLDENGNVVVDMNHELRAAQGIAACTANAARSCRSTSSTRTPIEWHRASI